MEKNINTKQNINLLKNEEFKELLNFESAYANTVKGGHYPYYYGSEKQERLINDVNLLTSAERISLATNYFISKN